MWVEIASHIGLYLLLTLFGVCGLAIFKGGRAEREGAILYLVLWIAAMLVPGGTEASDSFVYVLLLADALAAFGFLWLAIRYSNLWLAGAMIAQGICFGAHAFKLEDELSKPMWRGMEIHIMVMNITSALVLWLILFGTIASWRKRVKTRRAAELAARLTPEAAAA